MSVAELRQRLKHALEITQTASEVAMAHFRRPLDIETKSDESPVTIADKATESAIREGLLHHYPHDAIFGEEFGKTGIAEDMWIIDPIDGTRSFITGLPLFGMLLGYVVQGVPEMGIIRMPALNEVYAGGHDIPSTCNGNAIKTSTCTSLSAARLFINEGDKLAQRETAVFNRLIAAGNLRRMAADCYPHALVASGHADAVVDFDLQPYDYLPVSAVVEAAGGMMTDWQGNRLTMESDGRTLTAATPHLHADLLEIVNG
ncbi:inositol monophosphatase family protein [uncultured Sulfitobacter sp.]|uniref:inositol monophosphatase family protein n=1 Tax=uncultured Sulfitobacter sp. TaxID=191468 RepID=UPI00262F755C|nr:inositol monophosphatase family protein [uncultured Sulfitobacter sp.]